MARPPVSFIAWTSVSGRSQEIAESLGGDARCFFDFGFVNRRLIPLRYLISALRTVSYLLLRRPRSIIATNPPVFPGLIAYAYGRITGAPVVLDSHPSSFGFDPDNTVVSVGLPFYRFLIPRVAGTIVTEQSLVERVAEQGGRADIVHEAKPRWELPAAPPLTDRPNVLLVNVFAPDEPTGLVVEAARGFPNVDFHVTGDLRKKPAGLAAEPPPNVHFTGFLDQPAYLKAIEEANLVMTLTERPEDVARAACEAVYARRPLITSDWPAVRRYFPHAVAVANTVEGIAAGISDALERYDSLLEVAEAAREEQERRWDAQLAILRELVGAG
jgi:glycosyltransferase involved in cell wall biosynthesis